MTQQIKLIEKTDAQAAKEAAAVKALTGAKNNMITVLERMDRLEKIIAGMSNLAEVLFEFTPPKASIKTEIFRNGQRSYKQAGVPDMREVSAQQLMNEINQLKREASY